MICVHCPSLTAYSGNNKANNYEPLVISQRTNHLVIGIPANIIQVLQFAYSSGMALYYYHVVRGHLGICRPAYQQI